MRRFWLTIALVLILFQGSVPAQAGEALAADLETQGAPFLTFLTESGIAPAVASAGGISDQQRRAIIRFAYRNLERYAAPVSDLRFELEGFETIHEDEFHRRGYVAVNEMPGGRMVDVTRSRHTSTVNDDIVERTVTYVPRWADHVPYVERIEDGDLLASASIVEVMRRWVGEAAPLAEVERIITYRATVHLDGESRTYQAAFFWYPWRTGEEIRFMVMDHIVQGVGEAIKEQEPRVWRPSSTALPSISQRTLVDCQAEDDLLYKSKPLAQDANYHFSGVHSATVTFENRCACSSDCVSTCDMAVFTWSCKDEGVVADSLCHKMSSGRDSKDGIDWQGNGARCAGGFACAARSCPWGCSCAGVTVNVAASTTSVGFSFGEGALWTTTFQQTSTCYDCREATSGGEGGGSAPPGGDPNEESPPPSPILVDLGQGGIRLTHAATGVDFDIDGDGERERVAWTEWGAEDGFVALDRDHDGLIGSGRELFGNFTPQPRAEEKHGFNALAAFDEPDAGGDGDGWLSAADQLYELLVLWRDANQDGISQSEELVPLGEVVEALRLDYVESRRRDRHGNLFRYKSEAILVAQGAPRRQMVDVFLLVAE